MFNTLTLTRVANGWIIRPGSSGERDEATQLAVEFVHVATTSDELAGHVAAWATTHLVVLPSPAQTVSAP